MARAVDPTWMPISSVDGSRKGYYDVSAGTLTVTFQGKSKTTRASSTGLPKEHGADADKSLARLMLTEQFG